jgi:hypothetical protein
VRTALDSALAFIRIAANGPLICQIEEFAVRAALDSATHDGEVVSCKSCTLPSGVTAKVPLELPVIVNAVLPPDRQSKLTCRETPTLDRLTEIGFAILAPDLAVF